MITKPTPRLNRTATTLNRYRPQTQQPAGGLSIGAPTLKNPQAPGAKPPQSPIGRPGWAGPQVSRAPGNSPFQQGPQTRTITTSYDRPEEYRRGAGLGGMQAMPRPATVSPTAPGTSPGWGSNPGAIPTANQPGNGGMSIPDAYQRRFNRDPRVQHPASVGTSGSGLSAAPGSSGNWAEQGFAVAGGALQNGLRRIDPGNFASMAAESRGIADGIRGTGVYGGQQEDAQLDPFGRSGAGLTSAPQPEQPSAQEELYGTGSTSQGLTSNAGTQSSGARMPDGSAPPNGNYVDKDGDGTVDTYLNGGWQEIGLEHSGWRSGSGRNQQNVRGYTQDSQDFSQWAYNNSGGDIYVDADGKFRSRSGRLGGDDGTHGGYVGDDPANWDPRLRALLDGFENDPERKAAADAKEADEHNKRVQEALGLIPDAPQLGDAEVEAMIRADQQLRAMSAGRALNASIGDNRGRLGVGATAGLTAQTMAQAGAEGASAAAKTRFDAAIQNLGAQIRQYDAQISMLQGVMEREDNESAREFQASLMREMWTKKTIAEREIREWQAEQAREENLFEMAGQWIQSMGEAAGGGG